ncbi:MerR family transcriptional regulator [Loigolactobacillus coryniformis]|uniref:MerR family transcriptional regulator n=1 Tax=Loigolactobacillus coryniformis TaxID=1610 RepID=UPI00233FF21B|nr:MerR family transcriptional regulator [Loigolactobacillus coryniformis]MDC4186496.1 MerR family transcriptional regulator [Loigolactobacillus coryniformis]
MFGLTVSVLRYYDQEGLIPALHKNAAGVREFNSENLDALQMVACLKTSGMMLKDIKQFMQWIAQGDETLDLRLALFKQIQ